MKFLGFFFYLFVVISCFLKRDWFINLFCIIFYEQIIFYILGFFQLCLEFYFEGFDFMISFIIFSVVFIWVMVVFVKVVVDFVWFLFYSRVFGIFVVIYIRDDFLWGQNG